MTAVDWPAFTATDSPLEAIVKLSRYYGADPGFVLAGGGNTSVKVGDRLFVKASGTQLATITPEGFVELDRPALQRLLEAQPPADRPTREGQFKQAILAARTNPDAGQRPSVETVLHHMLPGQFVIHTHPAAVNMLTCCTDGEAIARELFGEDVIWIPFVDPGWLLARAVHEALQDFARRTGRSDCPPVLMANHGLLVAGDEPEAIRRTTDDLVAKVEQRLAAAGEPEAPFGDVAMVDAERADRLIRTIGPALRGLLGSDDALPVVTFDDRQAIGRLVGSAGGKDAAMAGPLTPDQIVYCLSFPLWVDLPASDDAGAIVEQLRAAVADHTDRTGTAPKVILVEKLGLFAAGEGYAAARTAAEVYADAATVMGGAARLGGILPLTDDARTFIENWEVEAYRRQVAARQKAAGRAAGKIALVTGAAQGFGLEIAQDLAAQGAFVVLADVNADGAAAAAAAINAGGPTRAMGLAMNVASAASIAEAVLATVRAIGGLDLLVSNAGVLRAASVKVQAEKDFDLTTAVNYKGYFLCVQGVSGVLETQHAARPGHMTDIIQINSKSGLEGSNKNFAYAGSKFGGIGLTQSFALELIADGVKVNSICPGNFFDGPLWSDPDNGLFVQYLRTGKVPGARTLDDVRRFYEAKVPMNRGCTTADVMKAVYYLMDQKYETGQAVPVTGGQVMLN